MYYNAQVGGLALIRAETVCLETATGRRKGIDRDRSVVVVMGDRCGGFLLIASIYLFFFQWNQKQDSSESEDGGGSFGGLKRQEKVWCSCLEERMNYRGGVGLLGSTEGLEYVIMSVKWEQSAWCLLSSSYIQLHGCRPVESWMLPGLGFLPGKYDEEEGYKRAWL